MQNDYRVLIPGFTVERRTKALSAGVWGFVGLISMFTVGIGVFAAHLMLTSVLGITSTFASDHMAIAGLAPILLFAAVFGVGLLRFILYLQTAYIIQPDQIIKGRITGNAIKNNVENLV